MDVGHGQMPETQLAAVMHRFNLGEIDILLSTTIIESGLDIPNANTLIVDRADTFGLAQLYQLRGRVGRGAMRAYAYFFRHKKITPTQDGQQRLEVIAENTQLGAGYSIAMRDLEIRGAGESARHAPARIYPGGWVSISTRDCWRMQCGRFAGSKFAGTMAKGRWKLMKDGRSISRFEL